MDSVNLPEGWFISDVKKASARHQEEMATMPSTIIAKAAARRTHARREQEPVGPDRAMYVCAACENEGGDFALFPRDMMRVLNGGWYCEDCACEMQRESGTCTGEKLPLPPELYTAPPAESAGEEDEAYEIGKRDGYEAAVQDIDKRTGGDGEYRFCTDLDPDRHTPDAPAMIQRIVDRINAESENVTRLRELLKEARDNGLIYWEPNTARGHVEKARMFARIEDILATANPGGN